MAIVLESELDPSHAQFYDEDHGGSENETDQLFSVLAVMAAFCMMGRVPLFTRGSMAAGTALDGAVTTASGNTYYGITLAAAEAQEAAFATGVLTQEGSNAIMASAVMNGGSSLNSVAAIIALNAYDVSSHSDDHAHIGHYFGHFLGGGQGGGSGQGGGYMIGGGPGGFIGGNNGGNGGNFGGGPGTFFGGGPGFGPGSGPNGGPPAGSGPGVGPWGGPSGYAEGGASLGGGFGAGAQAALDGCYAAEMDLCVNLD